MNLQTTEVCEWHDDHWKSCRFEIAPCPKVATTIGFHHELTVAGITDDGLSHLFCTCGWIGPGFKSDEEAVREHNRLQGIETKSIGEWQIHPNAADYVVNDDCDLPF